MRDIQRNRTRTDLRFFLVCICAPKCRNDPVHARRPCLCGRDCRLRVRRRALHCCNWGWNWVHVRLTAYAPRVHPWRYGFPARSRCQGRRFGRLGVISPAISRGVSKSASPVSYALYPSSAPMLHTRLLTRTIHVSQTITNIHPYPRSLINYLY